MNLIEFLWRSRDRYPLAEALVDEEIRWTYQELTERVERVAENLAQRGLGPDDHVLVVMSNRRENIIVYWACQRLGAIYTPVNFRMSESELAYCIQDAQPRLIVAEGGLGTTHKLPVLRESLDPPPPIIWVGEGNDTESFDSLYQPGQPPLGSDNLPSQFHPAIMLYTAGTTGRPKGVPRTHGNEISAAVAHIIQNRYQMMESTVAIMPLYHTMGMRSVLATTFLNGKLVLLPRYDPDMLAESIARERISALYLVPTLFYDLVNLRHIDQFDFHALDKIGYAGAAMTTALTAQCFERLSPQIFVNHFGSSEVYTFTVCSWLNRKPTCAGRPGFHEQVRIVEIIPGAGDPRALVKPGSPGEVIVHLSSPEAFQGYWNRPDATARALRDGWYFTGDVAFQDEDGDLWVQGRVDDMMISGGENIHPLEVEDVLSRHPKVAEVAVAGMPDPKWGQAVTAFVVRLDPSLTAEELDQYCLANTALADFKRPRQYIFVPEIPKSPVGKILRRKLRAGDYLP